MVTRRVLVLLVIAVVSVAVTITASMVLSPSILATATSYSLSGSTSHQAFQLSSKPLSPKLVISTPVVTIEDALSALANPEQLHLFNGSQVIQFTKSGGLETDGQFQKSLAVSNLVMLGDNETPMQFVYFVDSKHDATPMFYHSSDIRMHVYIDGRDIGVTPWLGYEDRILSSLPTNTGVISITNVSPGDHLVSLIPEGRVGGSNSGYLYAWGGTLVFLHNESTMNFTSARN